MLRVYADNMVAHRQNVFQVPMGSVEIRRFPGGEFDFDFTRFDQIAQVFWDTGKMDYLETGHMARFGERAWFSTEIILNDYNVSITETGETESFPGLEVIPQLMPAFESHLRRKGWLDKTLFHIRDEPTLRNSISWRETSRFINKYAPDLRRIDAVQTVNLFGDIEIAIPKIDYLSANYNLYKKGQQEGAELWMYTVGIYQASLYPNKTIDMCPYCKAAYYTG